jgi:hypothetical protein
MTKVSLLAGAIVAAFALVAAPAHGTFTPVNTAISANSNDSSLIVTAGVVITCPTSTFTGIINSDGGSFSGTVEFSRSIFTTCTITILGSSSSATVTCSLRVTLRSTTSAAGSSASGDAVIDAANPANACSIILPVHGCNITVAAQTIRNAWTLSQAGQIVNFSGARVAATGSGGLCGSGARTVTFTATYRISTPRITIS